jgi:hypothetical protein
MKLAGGLRHGKATSIRRSRRLYGDRRWGLKYYRGLACQNVWLCTPLFWARFFWNETA